MTLSFVETDQNFAAPIIIPDESLGVAGLIGQFERGPLNKPTRVNAGDYEIVFGNIAPVGSYAYYNLKGIFENYAQALVEVVRVAGSGAEEADSTFASEYAAPVCQDHEVACREGEAVTILLPFQGGQDEDPEYEIVTQPSAALGLLGIPIRMGDGSGWVEVVFTPDAGAVATETGTFTYRVYDGVNYSLTVTCSITMYAAAATSNHAYAAGRVCAVGDTISFSVEGVDYTDATPIAVPTVDDTLCTRGNLVQSGTTINFTYEVPTGQSPGTDSFTFTVQGGAVGESPAATFSLFVVNPMDHFTIQAAYKGDPDPGLWAQNNLSYAIEHVSGSVTLFNLFLYLNGALVGNHRGLTVAGMINTMNSSMYARIISDVGLVATGSYTPARPDETPLDGDGNYVPIPLGVVNAQVSAFTAGADGSALVEADYLGTSINGEGVYAFEASGRRFALIGCPESAALTSSFATSLKTFCQAKKMGRGVTLNGVDAEYAGTSLANIQGLQETGKTYLTNYGWGWGRVLGGPSFDIPLMGAIMGMTVRSWASRGHWKSAAGMTDGNLRYVISLSTTPRDIGEEEIYRNSGINVVKMDSTNSYSYVATCRTLSLDEKFKHGSRRDFLTWLVPKLNTLLGPQLEEPNVASQVAAIREDKLMPFFRNIENQAQAKSQCFKNNSADTDINIEFVTVSDSQTDVKIEMDLADPLNDMVVYLSQAESSGE